MALPNSNISTTLVGNTLGSSSRDVGTLCTHPNINKWSKWKPVRSSKTEPLTVTDIENLKSGLNRVDMYEVEYLKPTGGATSPYRIGDFRNYNHAAIPPVNVEIVQITEQSTGQVLTSPYTLIYDFNYKIEFRLPIAGEIDPATIEPRTVRTKNTTGDGGLSFVSGVTNEVQRTASQVFTCPSGTTVLSQTLTLNANGISYPLRMQYCTYNGVDYTTLPYAIEDMSFLNSFSFANLNVSLALNTFWDNVAGNVMSTLTVTNNTGRELLEWRVRYQYTINGGVQKNATGYIPSIAATGNTNSTNALETGTPGASNSYSVYAYLERLDVETSTWIVVQQINRTQSISIPA